MQFIALWEDGRHEASLWDNRTDVYGTRVSAGGVVLDPAGFAVVNAQAHEFAPATAGAEGATWLPCSVMADAAPCTAYRIGASVMGAEAPAGLYVARVTTGVRTLSARIVRR